MWNPPAPPFVVPPFRRFFGAPVFPPARSARPRSAGRSAPARRRESYSPWRGAIAASLPQKRPNVPSPTGRGAPRSTQAHTPPKTRAKPPHLPLHSQQSTLNHQHLSNPLFPDNPPAPPLVVPRSRGLRSTRSPIPDPPRPICSHSTPNQGQRPAPYQPGRKSQDPGPPPHPRAEGPPYAVGSPSFPLTSHRSPGTSPPLPLTTHAHYPGVQGPLLITGEFHFIVGGQEFSHDKADAELVQLPASLLISEE